MYHQTIPTIMVDLQQRLHHGFIQTLKKSKGNDKNKNENKCTNMLEKLFNQIMKAEKHDVKKAVESLIERITDKNNPFEIPNINDQS